MVVYLCSTKALPEHVPVARACMAFRPKKKEQKEQKQSAPRIYYRAIYFVASQR